MRVPLWEWAVEENMRSNSVGVSMTRHGAMTALSRALVESGQPARGSIAPVVLIDAAQSQPRYLRLPVMTIAVYDEDVIRWNAKCSTGTLTRDGTANQ
jgi:hypothetical protein